MLDGWIKWPDIGEVAEVSKIARGCEFGKAVS